MISKHVFPLHTYLQRPHSDFKDPKFRKIKSILTFKYILRIPCYRQAVLYVILPPAVQADKAVSQASHKVLVVVAWPEHQVPVDGQDPQAVQQGHLLSYRLVGSTELVEHSPVQTVVDRVKGKTLGTPLRLEEEK